MSSICQQAVGLRVSIVMLTSLLFISRFCSSVCGESDSDVSCSDPFPLLLVHFFRDKCNDVSLRVCMYQIDTESLPYIDVRSPTMAL